MVQMALGVCTYVLVTEVEILMRLIWVVVVENGDDSIASCVQLSPSVCSSLQTEYH